MGGFAPRRCELLDLIEPWNGLGLGKDLKYHLLNLFPPSQLFRALCRVVPPRRARKRPFLHLPIGFTHFSLENEAGTPPLSNSAHCLGRRGGTSSPGMQLQHGGAWICLGVREGKSRAKDKERPRFRARLGAGEVFMKNERGAGGCKERRR